MRVFREDGFLPEIPSRQKPKTFNPLLGSLSTGETQGSNSKAFARAALKRTQVGQISRYRSQGMTKGEVDGGTVIGKRYVVPMPER